MKKIFYSLPFLFLVLVLTGCQQAKDPVEVPKESVTKTTTATKMLHDPKLIEQVSAIIHTMPKDGMNDVKKIYPDLVFVKDVAKNDMENLSAGMSKESWMYSKSNDVTVVVCDMLNTPAHIFKGTTMSSQELDAAKKMMKEMMDMMKMEEMDENMDEEMEHENAAMKNEPVVEKVTLFEQYSAAKFAQAKGSQNTALFFHADWCPVCKNLEQSITTNLSSLPKNSVIFQVNFDTEMELKKKYGVRSQTTVVFLDKKGEVVATEMNPSIAKFTSFLSL